MSLSDIDAALSGGGARSAFTKHSPVGTSVTGTIVSAELRQINDYSTGKPRFWDDGKPQMQVAIRIQTALREGPDDDGIRGVYIKTWGKGREALQEAIKAAGGLKASDVLLPGAQFTATFIGTEPSKAGDPTKLYRYEIKPASAVGIDAALDTPAPATSAAPAAAPQPAASGPNPVETAKQLIAAGLDDALVAQSSGLPVETVAALRNAA